MRPLVGGQICLLGQLTARQAQVFTSHVMIMALCLDREVTVGVDSFWKRVAPQAIEGCGPQELSDVVPYWFDEQFRRDVDQGLLVAEEDNGVLIDALLLFGASDPEASAAARLFRAAPPDWDDDWMVGTLDPATVQLIAVLFARAPLDQWAEQHHDELADTARQMGYQRPFDREWSGQVVRDAREIASLFQAAAAEHQAIIHKISA